MINQQFIRFSREVRAESISRGISSISEDEGLIIYSIISIYSMLKRKKLYVIDAGSGIGYSTLWISKALEDSNCDKCLVDSIEIKREYYEVAMNILNKYKFGKVMVRIINSDAITYVSSLDDKTIDIIFVDIEKKKYADMLDILVNKISDNGLVMFHNIIKPPPPEEFNKKVEGLFWKKVVIPTKAGILLMIK